MPDSPWTEADSRKALQIWADYQRQHDVSDRRGQAVGIDPASGRVWFGESAADIAAQLQAGGTGTPLYFLRVGSGYYQRKGKGNGRVGGASSSGGRGSRQAGAPPA
jgi:hypothetical protein